MRSFWSSDLAGVVDRKRCGSHCSSSWSCPGASAGAWQLFHRSETPDHFEHDKKEPRRQQSYATPKENGIHRIDAFGTEASMKIYGPQPPIVPAQCAIARSRGLLGAASPDCSALIFSRTIWISMHAAGTSHIGGEDRGEAADRRHFSRPGLTLSSLPRNLHLP